MCAQLDPFVYWSMIKWDCTCDPICFSNCTHVPVWMPRLHPRGLMIIKEKGIRPVGVSQSLISSVQGEMLYQPFWRGGVDNDCVLIRKQTGCGRAGTGEGEAPWTRRDRGASVKRSREAAVCSLWRMVYDTRTEPVTRHNHSVLTHHSASPDCSCSTPGYWPAFISQTANRMTASFQRRSCTRILFPTWPVIFDRSEGQTFTLNI